MKPEEQLAKLVEEIDSIVRTTASESHLDAPDLRRILRFVSKVIQIVEQSFEEVLGLLIEIKQLTFAEAQPGRLAELRRSVELLTARSHYRDAEEICSRLKHLRENFDQFIRPSVHDLPQFTSWSGLFGLIEDREGRIIMLVEESARQIGLLLDGIDQGKLAKVHDLATMRADELRVLVSELRNLNGRILGVSGATGFLELTADRSTLTREINIFMDKRDQSITHGHRVSFGRGAKITGDVIVANEIKDSFNQANAAGNSELQALLEKLCVEVDKMLPKLPEGTQTQTKQALATLVTEATSEKPRREWYELSGKGLVDAAKACGKMAAPVVATVKAILPLLA